MEGATLCPGPPPAFVLISSLSAVAPGDTREAIDATPPTKEGALLPSP